MAIRIDRRKVLVGCGAAVVAAATPSAFAGTEAAISGPVSRPDRRVLVISKSTAGRKVFCGMLDASRYEGDATDLAGGIDLAKLRTYSLLLYDFDPASGHELLGTL